MNAECLEAGHVLVGLEGQYFLLAQVSPLSLKLHPPPALQALQHMLAVCQVLAHLALHLAFCYNL